MFSSIKADSLGEKTDCSKCIAQFQILGIQLCVTHKIEYDLMGSPCQYQILA